MPFKKNINKFKNSNFESLIDSIDDISDGFKSNKFTVDDVIDSGRNLIDGLGNKLSMVFW